MRDVSSFLEETERIVEGCSCEMLKNGEHYGLPLDPYLYGQPFYMPKTVKERGQKEPVTIMHRLSPGKKRWVPWKPRQLGKRQDVPTGGKEIDKLYWWFSAGLTARQIEEQLPNDVNVEVTVINKQEVNGKRTSPTKTSPATRTSFEVKKLFLYLEPEWGDYRKLGYGQPTIFAAAVPKEALKNTMGKKDIGAALEEFARCKENGEYCLSTEEENLIRSETVSSIKFYLNNLGLRHQYHNGWIKEGLLSVLLVALSEDHRKGEKMRDGHLNSILEHIADNKVSGKKRANDVDDDNNGKNMEEDISLVNPVPDSNGAEEKETTGIAVTEASNGAEEEETTGIAVTEAISQNEQERIDSVDTSKVVSAVVQKTGNDTAGLTLSTFYEQVPSVEVNLGRLVDDLVLKKYGQKFSNLVRTPSVRMGKYTAYYAQLPKSDVYGETNMNGIGGCKSFNYSLGRNARYLYNFHRAEFGITEDPKCTILDAHRVVRAFRSKADAQKNLKIAILCQYGRRLLQNMVNERLSQIPLGMKNHSTKTIHFVDRKNSKNVELLFSVDSSGGGKYSFHRQL